MWSFTKNKVMQVQGPRNQRSNIAVVFNTDDENVMPSIVTMTPVRRPGDDVSQLSSFDYLARALKRKILQRLRAYLGWTNERLLKVVNGSLMMRNITGNGQTFTDDVSLRDINGETFMDHFARPTASGSAPDLEIWQVEWNYWINPASIQIGRGKNFNNPKNIKGLNYWDYKLFKTYTGTIGCAAIALTIGLVFKIDDQKHKNLKHNIKKSQSGFGQYALEIQTALHFEDPMEVTISEMGGFVCVYKDYRVVVLQSVVVKPYVYIGSSYTYHNDPKLDKTIYIYHDVNTQHYCYCSSPGEFVSSSRNNNWTFCKKCCTSWNRKKEGSHCGCVKGEENYGKKSVRKRKLCDQCGDNYVASSQHRCFAKKCRTCTLFYKERNSSSHRCPLYINPKTFMKNFEDDDDVVDLGDTSKKLFTWDIESHLVPIEDVETQDYEIDDDGMFIVDDNGKPKSYTITKCQQIPNYVAWQNVFTGETGEGNLENFIEFALNQEDAIFLAHNSSGYDSRLLFDALSKISTEEKIEPIFRGSKFMQLKVGKITFQDSLLHLTSSLSKLGKAFGLPVEKGHFPHLFNRPENLDYEGLIPDKACFDVGFSCATENDFKEFNEWHDEWTASKRPWNLKYQLETYCKNDVDMLAKIVKLYHEHMIGSLSDYPHLQVSPWFFPTLAGYVHKLMVRHLHHGKNIEEMNYEDLQDYVQKTWAVLEPEEFYFDKLALRGGSTNICRYDVEGKIHYKDIQSSYPSVQMESENLYPVGTPVIEVHDLDYYPCKDCSCNPMVKCYHSLEVKRESITLYKKKLVIKEVAPVDLHEYCMNFFGTICVDIIPPRNLYHPIIQTYDEKKKKVIGTLDPIYRETITSPTLHLAIQHGYKVTKIYRAQRYKSAPSIYRNGLLGHLYVNKMKNSMKAPEGEERQKMIDTFKSKFNIELGDMDLWEKNPVLKAIFKGPPTSAWGKHAESVDHPMSKICDSSDMDFYESIQENKSKLVRFRCIGQERIMFDYKENRTTKRPDLHKGYMPVAVFVTTYGRLKLWKELNKLGKRVIMYDTDSIVYEHEEGGYDIPEGNCLGDWETEDFEIKNGGISHFTSIGPKSYCITGGNGEESMKLKGACIKYGHSKMINGAVMKDMVLNGKSIDVPQMSFDWVATKSMSTRKFLKHVMFRETDVKGDYNKEERRAYPFGWKE